MNRIIKINSIALFCFLSTANQASLANSDMSLRPCSLNKSKESPHKTSTNKKPNKNNYKPYLEIGGSRFFSGSSKSASGFDFFIPFWQKPNEIIFADARFYDRSGKPFEGNIHLGYRKMLPETKHMYGIYGAFDRKHSEQGNYFSQLTLGAEAWLGKLFIGGNIYQPIGNSSNRIKLEEKIKEPVYKNVWVTTNKQYEKALQGVDFQIGHEITSNLTAYVGGYYFKSKDTNVICGPKAKISYDYSLKNGKNFLGPFNKIGLETGIQNDKARGAIGYLSANLRIDLAPYKNPPIQKVSRHMIDLVRRDVDIVSTNTHNIHKDVFFGRLETVASKNDLLKQISDPNVRYVAIEGPISLSTEKNIELNKSKKEIILGNRLNIVTEEGTHLSAILNKKPGYIVIKNETSNNNEISKPNNIKNHLNLLSEEIKAPEFTTNDPSILLQNTDNTHKTITKKQKIKKESLVKKTIENKKDEAEEPTGEAEAKRKDEEERLAREAEENKKTAAEDPTEEDVENKKDEMEEPAENKKDETEEPTGEAEENKKTEAEENKTSELNANIFDTLLIAQKPTTNQPQILVNYKNTTPHDVEYISFETTIDNLKNTSSKGSERELNGAIVKSDKPIQITNEDSFISYVTDIIHNHPYAAAASVGAVILITGGTIYYIGTPSTITTIGAKLSSNAKALIPASIKNFYSQLRNTAAIVPNNIGPPSTAHAEEALTVATTVATKLSKNKGKMEEKSLVKKTGAEDPTEESVENKKDEMEKPAREAVGNKKDEMEEPTRETEVKRKIEEERLAKEAEVNKKTEAEDPAKEAEAKRKGEEGRLAKEAEAKRKGEEERLAREAEAKIKGEEERLAKEAEIKRKDEEERSARETEAKRKVEKERLAKGAEIKRKDEKERLAKETEAKRKVEEGRLAKEAEAKRKGEKERLARETEAKRKGEEERLAKEAEAKRKNEEERSAREAEVKRKSEEERRDKEAKAKRKNEEERRYKEAEAKRKAEEERSAREAEVKRKSEEERRDKEAKAKRKNEEERSAREAEVKRKSEEERRDKEAKAKRKGEEERLAKEAEAKRKAEEERLAREAKVNKKTEAEAEAEAEDPAEEAVENKKDEMEEPTRETEVKRKVEEERRYKEAEVKRKAEEERSAREAGAEDPTEEAVENKKDEMEEPARETEVKRKIEMGEPPREKEAKSPNLNQSSKIDRKSPATFRKRSPDLRKKQINFPLPVTDSPSRFRQSSPINPNKRANVLTAKEEARTNALKRQNEIERKNKEIRQKSKKEKEEREKEINEKQQKELEEKKKKVEQIRQAVTERRSD